MFAIIVNMKTTPVYNDYARQLEEKKKTMSAALATLLHESWRKGCYVAETKSYTPRPKITKDQEWITKHNGLTEVDLANTPFVELPTDWQEENLLSAKVALEKIEDVLYLIHDSWLDRNDRHASEQQKTQYSRLPNHEKLKDVGVLEDAIRIIKEDAQ